MNGYRPIDLHDDWRLTSDSDIVDCRENEDRMVPWSIPPEGLQGMATTRSRFQVILILLLGTSIGCFPARTLPLLGSSFPVLRDGLSHLPQKPLRLRMFHSGSETAMTQRRIDQGRQRLDRADIPELTTSARTRLVGPRPLPTALALPVPPLRC
jgi:hypothetical protein